MGKISKSLIDALIGYTGGENHLDAQTMRRIFESTPVLSEWLELINDENTRDNAASHIVLSFCIGYKFTLAQKKEARERRARNAPHATKVLNYLEKAKTELGFIENTAATAALSHINELQNEISQIFIEKSDRTQKSGWQDYIEFALSQLSLLNGKHETKLVLRESDLVSIIQAVAGNHVSRNAVKNWIARRKSTNCYLADFLPKSTENKP